MKFKCQECGEMTKEVKEPFIILSIGTILEDSATISLIHCSDVDHKDEAFYKAGQRFREWWNGHVAGGFDDGFSGR